MRSEAGPTIPEAALQAGLTMKHVSSIAWSISYIMKWPVLSPNANLTVLKFPCSLSPVVILEWSPPSLWVVNSALLLSSCLGLDSS